MNIHDNAIKASYSVFCDIDGTLVEFPESFEEFKKIPTGNKPMKALKGTLDKLWEWETKGYKIILTTGRKESMRPHTERQLREVGIFWDHLIMGLGPGKRVLINDKNNGKDTAFSVNLERNEGIEDVDLDSISNQNSADIYEDICCSPPEKRHEFHGKEAEKEAIRIANQRYNEALQEQ